MNSASDDCSRVLGVLCTITVFCIAAWSQVPKPSPQVKASEPAPSAQPFAPEMTSADVGAFLDGLVPQQLEREDIAGALLW